MRAVIIGTDFMKDTDGSFKALETNTNIQLDTQWSYNVDLSSFENFVTSNNFSEIVLISNDNHLSPQSSYTINYDFEYIDDVLKKDDTQENHYKAYNDFKSYLTDFTSGSGITLNTLKTDLTSVSIPYVEDADDKLIIRLSYDATALIDDTYARDNWEFLKLMYDADPTSVPACYINDSEVGFDSIGTTLKDNGNHPNYCIKKRVTPTDNKTYPKLFKINTIEELDNLKSALEVDEYIQEFIYNTNDLLDNRVKSYRSIDLLYGPNLDILNLQVIEKTTNLEIVDSADFDDNNEIQYWDRMRYCQKFYTSINEIAIKLDASSDTKIVLPDGSITNPSNLNIGDSVKSIIFSTLPTSNLFSTSEEQWSGSFIDTTTNYTVSSSVLQNEFSMDYFGALVIFETDTDSTFSDLKHAYIMVKDGDYVKFKQYGNLSIGDTIIQYDTQTDQLITANITNISYKFDKFVGYTLDFEESDLFLTLEETSNQSRYGLLTHNYDFDCQYVYCPRTNWITSFQYYDCGSGTVYNYWAYSFQGQTTSACVRVNGPYAAYCQNYNENTNEGYIGYGGYCNNQKSDIRYKENINLIGKSPSGLNIYEFNYKNQEGLYNGIIAQELIGTHFENVLSINNEGMYDVDYNRIDVEFKKIK